MGMRNFLFLFSFFLNSFVWQQAQAKLPCDDYSGEVHQLCEILVLTLDKEQYPQFSFPRVIEEEKDKNPVNDLIAEVMGDIAKDHNHRILNPSEDTKSQSIIECAKGKGSSCSKSLLYRVSSSLAIDKAQTSNAELDLLDIVKEYNYFLQEPRVKNACIYWYPSGPSTEFCFGTEKSKETPFATIHSPENNKLETLKVKLCYDHFFAWLCNTVHLFNFKLSENFYASISVTHDIRQFPDKKFEGGRSINRFENKLDITLFNDVGDSIVIADYSVNYTENGRIINYLRKEGDKERENSVIDHFDIFLKRLKL